MALGKLGDVAIIPTLIQTLQEGSAPIGLKAAAALGCIGIVAVPALIQAFKDGNEDVRWNTARALGKIGDAQPLPLKILSSLQLTPVQKRDALETLSHIYFQDERMRLDCRYLTPIDTYCRSLLMREDVDADTKEGAEAILKEMERSRQE